LRREFLGPISGLWRINMSDAHKNNDCYLDSKKTVSGEMICLSETCIICKEGKWEETNKISVL
jgi:hypothetical protein